MPRGANARRRGAVLGGASRRVNRRDNYRRKWELLAVQRPNEVQKEREERCSAPAPQECELPSTLGHTPEPETSTLSTLLPTGEPKYPSCSFFPRDSTAAVFPSRCRLRSGRGSTRISEAFVIAMNPCITASTYFWETS